MLCRGCEEFQVGLGNIHPCGNIDISTNQCFFRFTVHVSVLLQYWKPPILLPNKI